jgi:hypothetical protein
MLGLCEKDVLDELYSASRRIPKCRKRRLCSSSATRCANHDLVDRRPVIDDTAIGKKSNRAYHEINAVDIAAR